MSLYDCAICGKSPSIEEVEKLKTTEGFCCSYAEHFRQYLMRMLPGFPVQFDVSGVIRVQAKDLTISYKKTGDAYIALDGNEIPVSKLVLTLEIEESPKLEMDVVL